MVGHLQYIRHTPGGHSVYFISPLVLCVQEMSSPNSNLSRRFPIEAGDSVVPGCVSESQEPRDKHHPHKHPSPHQLRRCPGSHCLTIPHVPIDVYIGMSSEASPSRAT
ncbi:protein FAM229B-like [Acipenser oxyrinchus oxyrinchus]|uniref:Protein FAM229B-like n=1 Tax=Acipenser oxyrinchus oxyrinchus TaxID=40147 RepID=A0AAD8CEW5_ACIOX|nr:protein FAM229B-like [Acipenser oxyrinchus oxyrinchus]